MSTFLLIPSIPEDDLSYAKHISLNLYVDTSTYLPSCKYIEHQCAKDPVTQMKSLGSQITVQNWTFSPEFNKGIMLWR